MQLECLVIRVPLIPGAGFQLISIIFFPCKHALTRRKYSLTMDKHALASVLKAKISKSLLLC